MTLFAYSQFRTRDPKAFVDQMRPVAPPFHLASTEKEFAARVQMLPLPRMGLFLSKLSEGEVAAESLGATYSINVPLAEGIGRVAGGRVREVPVGDAWVVPADTELRLRFRNGAAVFVANVDASLVHAYSNLIATSARGSLQISLSTTAGARLFQLLTIHWRDALRAKHAVYSLARIQQIQQSTVEAFVAAIWPEVSQTFASSEGRRILARAVDAIRGGLGGALCEATLAKSARTTTETLHRVFLDHTGLSPMAYLRRERLNATRRRLLCADPAGPSVAETAGECGFADLERFLVSYRAAFGESPSEPPAS
jgi:AraC-like DNA-binding protein